jgi:hypothetical protein
MLVLCCLLARAGCALAEEPRGEPRAGGPRPPRERAPPLASARTVAPSEFHFNGEVLATPEPHFDAQFERAPPPLAGTRNWGTEFRPHGPGLSSRPAQTAEFLTAPSLHATNAWQRLEDYKARRGIRLLTLWESKFSTLSLQAGRSGIPSLQWTSRSFSRGDASQGLLDRLVSKGLDELGSLEHRDTMNPSSGEPAAEKK